MVDTRNDEPLLPRIAAGDRSAVASFMDRYGNLVWSLARRFVRDRGDAEDAVQEIFIELWSSASRFDPERAAESTFVAMIARRRLIDRVRKTTREPTSEELTAATDIAHDPVAETVEIRDEATRAAEMLAELRPEQRQVIALSVYHGYTHRTISDKLEMPLGTVKTHLRRGLLRLREAMERDATGPAGGGASS